MGQDPIATQFSFSTDYSIRHVDRIDHPAKVIHFSGATDVADQVGVEVEIVPRGSPSWIGRFNRGTRDVRAVNGVFSYPDPGVLCVVAGGQAYLIETNDPSEWETVDSCFPVMDVREVPNTSLIIFVDYLKIAAYASSGLLWQSDRLSDDGIKIYEVSSNKITGASWSAARQVWVDFEVDTRSGAHSGGVTT